MNYLFYDGVCPKPYTLHTLETEPMGGTEATVLRVARGLTAKRHSVIIMQRGREKQELHGAIRYEGLEATLDDMDLVVTLRDAGHLVMNHGLYKSARHYLWLHDVVSREYTDHLVQHLSLLQGVVNLICVSNWHMNQVKKALSPFMSLHKLSFRVIYNPLADYCVKDDTAYDPHKLVFFSSPHKGLNHVLEAFARLLSRNPSFTLYIANPGYYTDSKTQQDGVINLGALPHEEIIKHVKGALCTFYPQTTFEETFGLVLAESNAVGTPVIAHPIGAASEILDHQKQLINCKELDRVVNLVESWSHGERLIVGPKAQFKLNEVIKYWELL